MLPLLDEREPCYILYRLDSKGSHGYDWLYISYVPEFAQVLRDTHKREACARHLPASYCQAHKAKPQLQEGPAAIFRKHAHTHSVGQPLWLSVSVACDF